MAWDWGRIGLGIASGGLSEAARGAKNLVNPSGGYDTAAEGAKGASDSFKGLSEEQWRRSMEGLDRANGAYGNSEGLWSGIYGGEGKPGAMEDWWSQNKAAFNGPTAGRDAMNGYNAYMGQPTNSQTSLVNNSGSLGYSASQDYNNRFGGQLQNKSAAESFYNPQNYQNPGVSEQFAGQAQGDLGHSGSMENWYANHNGDFQAQNRAGAAYGDLNAKMGVAGKTENLQHQDTRQMQSFAGGLAGAQGQGQTNAQAQGLQNMYLGANDTSRFADQQMGNLGHQGLYEQFVQSDITGRNPLMERGLDQGLARVNQEMARRGAFKSGAADTAVGNMVGEFEAQDYQNRAQRAQSAQNMEIARIGAGQSLAQASAQGKIAQGTALQSLAGQRDIETMKRLDQQLQGWQGASGESILNTGQRLDYAKASDANLLARLSGQMALASSADQSGVAALTGAANAANMAQSQTQSRNTALGNIMNQSQASELARLAGGQNAAGQSDTGFINRMKTGADFAHQSDTDNLARVKGLFDMNESTDRLNLDRYKTQFDMGQGVDQTDLARLLGGGAMADRAGGAARQRQNDAFMSRFGLDAAHSGNINSAYGRGMDSSGSASSDSFNAMADYFKQQGMGQNADSQFYQQILGSLLGRSTGGGRG